MCVLFRSCENDVLGLHTSQVFVITVRASEASAQCIVIGPVCGFVCVCGSVIMITRNCVHQSSPNWVCR